MRPDAENGEAFDQCRLECHGLPATYRSVSFQLHDDGYGATAQQIGWRCVGASVEWCFRCAEKRSERVGGSVALISQPRLNWLSVLDGLAYDLETAFEVYPEFVRAD